MIHPRGARLTIVNVGYQSTNYWVIGAGTSRLIVDLGFPGTMATLRARLDRMGVPLGELRYALATHYHIDHAGAAQDLKNAGVPLLVLPPQVDAIALMKRHVKPHDHYTEIVAAGNVVIPFAESRARLAEVGIDGEVLPTPGHSDDSVTLLLDDGSAFTGDLTPPGFEEEANAEAVAASWRMLRDRGASRLYPGHGPPRPFPVVA
jgi:glyoxylase-like metal-dependent hydrolase (beta-lactamase superfamily II)